MDEGLNTFVQYLTEQEFERNYPSRRGPPSNMIEYMKEIKKIANNDKFRINITVWK